MQRIIISILILFMLPLAAKASCVHDSLDVNEPRGYAYDQTTFSNQREILDFIKTINFDKKPPLKKLNDFYNDEKKIPDNKVLRKGVDLYKKGNVKKAVDYFRKLYMSKINTPFEKNYAAWQVVHYVCFGELDIYYNGKPSRMDRTNMHGNITDETKVQLSVDNSYFLSSCSQ